MRINYKELSEQYNESGLTKKAFGDRIGMSSSMVSYYLKKASQAPNDSKVAGFARIEVNRPTGLGVIKISTSTGMSIEIPI